MPSPCISGCDVVQLATYLPRYPEILGRYSEEQQRKKRPPKANDGEYLTLVQLDDWAREDLPALVASRTGPNRCLNKDELVKVMKWKMARGKFRPTLMPLVSSNDAALVRSVTAAAFETLSAVSLSSRVEGGSDVALTARSRYATVQAALRQLCQLKGVGAATATAIVSLLHPSHALFLSDEVVEVIMKEKPKYTVEYYKKVWDAVDNIQQGARASGWAQEMRMNDWELAAWAMIAERKLDEASGSNEVETEPAAPTRTAGMPQRETKRAGKKVESDVPAKKSKTAPGHSPAAVPATASRSSDDRTGSFAGIAKATLRRSSRNARPLHEAS